MTAFSARDIKNRKFKQSLMGVDADDVKSFLKIVAVEFDRILAQNAQLEKKLSEQTLKSTFGSKREAERTAEKNRKTLEDADRTAEEIVATAGEEAGDIRQKAERDAEEIRRKTDREAHEKARRETALMLSQAKVMADEIVLNAKQKAERILAEAKAVQAPASTPDFERPLSVSGRAAERPGFDSAEPDDWDMKHAEDAQKSFDSIIGEAMAKAESIIQDTRAEAEMITRSLIGRTLGELNKEHERLLTAVQNAVQKSEQIVRAAREEAEQMAVQRKSDAVEQCNAVLLEAEQKAEAIFSNLRSRAAARKFRTADDGKPGPGGRRTAQKFQ
jgi:cell division septum initiation protein DivIVA